LAMMVRYCCSWSRARYAPYMLAMFLEFDHAFGD
jgi:hypothetical protein